MNSVELISVILPVYNAEKYLSDAIESILAQSYSHFELILINDGSTDKSLAICKQYEKRDHRIVLLENEKNLGVVQTLKNGLKSAKGTFIARMDADDISEAERFQKQFDFLKVNPNIAIVGTSVFSIDADGQKSSELPLSYLESNTLKLSSYLTQPFFHGSIMARAKVFQEHNYGQDSKAEDFELWLRINTEGYLLANLADRLYNFRSNPTSVSSQNEEEQKRHHNEISKHYLEKLLGRKIDVHLVSILNNRPSKKVSFRELADALRLFKELQLKLKVEGSIETKQYIKRQEIDIHLQAFKMARNKKASLQILLALFGRLGDKTAITFLFQKLRKKNG